MGRAARSHTDSLTRPFAVDHGWPAPAKLNLFLHVTGRRSDGYHELQTVFQFLDYADTLYFTPRGDGVCRRVEGADEIPADRDLAVRAARLLSEISGAGLGADIRVIKRIPIGGGLGGGSSDAATTLVALNRIWNLGLPYDEIAELGLRLGADVPVFVRAHAAWAEGVGERLWPIELPEPWFLVVTPPVSVSTAEVFAAPALRRDTPLVDLQRFRSGEVGNDCEPVTRALHPEVGAVLDWLAHHGVARMSGTGASCFVAFDTLRQAESVRHEVPAEWQAFVARGLNRSPLADIMRGL
jgi:4-diphosphocytidyl-2-C-methyl-D-erythritol kinase